VVWQIFAYVLQVFVDGLLLILLDLQSLLINFICTIASKLWL